MRTHSTQDDKVFASAGQASYVRVSVQDAGSTWRDLTALFGNNYLDDLDFEETVDAGVQTCSFTVDREVFKNSLAPFVGASRLNQLGGGTKLLALGAAVRVEVQIQGSGVPADATKWQQLFLGRIVHRDDANGEKIKVECHDQASYLQQTFVEKDRPYGVWQPGRRYLAGTVIVPLAYAQTPADPAAQFMRVGTTGTTNGDVWKPSTVYATGSVVQPNTSPLGTFYKNNGSSFTSGGSEPTWPGSNTGGTVADNGGAWTEIGTSEAAFEPAWPAKSSGLTVSEAGTGTITYTEQTVAGTPLETQIQQILDDNYGVGAVTLYTPVSPAYYVRAYGQKRASTWDAIKALADGCIGWDLRYYWDNGTSAYRLTLQPPGGSTSARTTPTSSYTFSLGKYRDISTFAQDLAAIRNKVSIKYGNRAVLDTANQPTATEYVAIDQTSINTYGKAFCEIGEEGTGYISTTAEATTLGNNVLADLKDPLVDAVLLAEFCWWMQLNDGITVAADNLHFDADQLLCIYSIKHSFKGNGVAETSFQLRGKPCSRWQHWHNLGTGPGRQPTNRNTSFRPPPAPIVTPTIAGGAIVVKPPALGKAFDYQGTEIHVSATNGFTPSASTLVTTTKGGRVDLGTLTPGTTYYARCAHRDGRGTAPIYSAQTSFVAGQIQSFHIAPGAITTAALSARAVTADIIAPGAVVGPPVTSAQSAASYTLVGNTISLIDKATNVLAAFNNSVAGNAGNCALIASGALGSTAVWSIECDANLMTTTVNASFPSFGVVVTNGTSSGVSTAWASYYYFRSGQLNPGAINFYVAGTRISALAFQDGSIQFSLGGYGRTRTRLFNDGAGLLHYQHSNDGENWTDLYSGASPSGLTHYGFFIGTEYNGTSAPIRATIFKNALTTYGSTRTSAISGASGTPIVITTAAAHGYVEGDVVQISGVGGNTSANGQFMIHVLSSTTFSLLGTTTNAPYTSGGTVVLVGR